MIKVEFFIILGKFGFGVKLSCYIEYKRGFFVWLSSCIAVFSSRVNLF